MAASGLPTATAKVRSDNHGSIGACRQRLLKSASTTTAASELAVSSNNQLAPSKLPLNQPRQYELAISSNHQSAPPDLPRQHRACQKRLPKSAPTSEDYTAAVRRCLERCSPPATTATAKVCTDQPRQYELAISSVHQPAPLNSSSAYRPAPLNHFSTYGSIELARSDCQSLHLRPNRDCQSLHLQPLARSATCSESD